jgi:uncharacterized protein
MMGRMIVYDDFRGERHDERLLWHHPPSRWSMGSAGLVVFPDAETDFWQRTHYGFRADNGHFLGLPVQGDFVLTTRVRCFPVHQYDQAGLMVRYSPQCWLKTSVEYESHGPCRLGAVVTQGGYSDWSTQNYPPDRNEVELRVRKAGNDFTVEYSDSRLPGTADQPAAWTQIRLAHLEGAEGVPLLAGLYACSPKGAGFRAEFEFLRVDEPSMPF